MKSKPNKSIQTLKNWKVRPETLRRVNIECARLDLKQYELADMILECDLAVRKLEQLEKELLERQSKNGVADRLVQDIVTDDALRGPSRIDRKFMHWLLDKIMERESPHFAAIEYNLFLLAFGLFATQGQATDDLRQALYLLYENETKTPQNERPRAS